MALDKKLQDWVEAGVIDAATADRIRLHEARPERPTLLYAVSGLGLLALVLGVMLVISANWDRIADWVKLGAHAALLAGNIAAIWWARRARRPWVAEGLLFFLAGLVIAGIALHAQVFQQTGPAWQALVLWLALAGPALLLGGATRLTAYAFGFLLLVGPGVMAVSTLDDGGLWTLWQGLAMAVPFVLLLLSLAPRIAPPGFRMGLREAGVLTILVAASLAHFAWASEILRAQSLDNLVRLGPAAVACALAVLAARTTRELPAALVLPLTVGPLVASVLALAVPHQDHMFSRLIGMLIFIGMWAAVARGAAVAGWSALFGIAIAAIGVRIFIIYIELFGSLAATGGGLIAGGLLLIALTWGWHRIVQKRQPT